jgi:small subunit ribosomal protein S17
MHAYAFPIRHSTFVIRNLNEEMMDTEQKKRGIRKSQVGIVTSTAMQKTVTVAVDRLVQHTLYKKIQRKTSKFLAHDENGACKVGDRVRIVETRPLSARKRWRVEKVLTSAASVD